MADRPTFNHTRGDGPFDPCPACLVLMPREDLLALVRDLTERVTDGCKACRLYAETYGTMCPTHAPNDLEVLRLRHLLSGVRYHAERLCGCETPARCLGVLRGTAEAIARPAAPSSGDPGGSGG